MSSDTGTVRGQCDLSDEVGQWDSTVNTGQYGVLCDLSDEFRHLDSTVPSVICLKSSDPWTLRCPV